MFIDILFFIFGMGMLIFGGHLLVKGASTLASWLKVPAMIIGLTIVSIGTSMPELIVNIQSAFKGSTGLALGNILGSNIVNILLILGIGAIITPLVIEKSTKTKDMPLMLLASIIIWVIANDKFLDGSTTNMLSIIDGIILLSFFIIFLVYMYFSTINNHNIAIDKVVTVHRRDLLKSMFFIPVGIILLGFGGDIVVVNAIDIAHKFSVSERIIGLTIVAIGTSLPELITTIIAALKKESEILIGNIIGSNIFNIFFILGATAVIKPLNFAIVPNIDFIFTIGSVMLLFVLLYVGKRNVIQRNEGILLVIMYIVYMFLLL